jgi:hypothetical protein
LAFHYPLYRKISLTGQQPTCGSSAGLIFRTPECRSAGNRNGSLRWDGMQNCVHLQVKLPRREAARALDCSSSPWPAMSPVAWKGTPRTILESSGSTDSKWWALQCRKVRVLANTSTDRGHYARRF